MHCAQCLLSDELAYAIDSEPKDDDDEEEDNGMDVGPVFGDWEVTDFEPPALGREEGGLFTPGFQVAYMKHTGCHQLLSSTIHPVRIVIHSRVAGCLHGP